MARPLGCWWVWDYSWVGLCMGIGARGGCGELVDAWRGRMCCRLVVFVESVPSVR